MNESDWPEAFSQATFIVLGKHHCGISDCCGAVSREQQTEIQELAANLVGLDEYVPNGGEFDHWFDLDEDEPEADQVTNKKGR